MTTRRKKPADHLLERRLVEFSYDKSKEKYVRLLEAFRIMDVLVPSVPASRELPLGNRGILAPSLFIPDVLYVASLNKRLMPVFSDQNKIPSDYASSKTVFMHCSDWIKVFRTTKSEGVILNPFSEYSFVLTPDQIRVLSLFSATAAEYR
ncbi:MAG: SseB family protein [Alphaproteobacteria bacterium]|nr:SseB family protein [Alphaproteobacteria bacterium]